MEDPRHYQPPSEATAAIAPIFSWDPTLLETAFFRSRFPSPTFSGRRRTDRPAGHWHNFDWRSSFAYFETARNCRPIIGGILARRAIPGDCSPPAFSPTAVAADSYLTRLSRMPIFFPRLRVFPDLTISAGMRLRQGLPPRLGDEGSDCPPEGHRYEPLFWQVVSACALGLLASTGCADDITRRGSLDHCSDTALAFASTIDAGPLRTYPRANGGFPGDRLEWGRLTRLKGHPAFHLLTPRPSRRHKVSRRLLGSGSSFFRRRSLAGSHCLPANRFIGCPKRRPTDPGHRGISALVEQTTNSGVPLLTTSPPNGANGVPGPAGSTVLLSAGDLGSFSATALASD